MHLGLQPTERVYRMAQNSKPDPFVGIVAKYFHRHVLWKFVIKWYYTTTL